MRNIGLGLALAAVAMNGCAGVGAGAPGAADSYRSVVAPGPEAAPPPAPGVVAAAPPAPPAAYADSAMSGGASSRSMEPAPATAPKSSALPAPSERPGLGTEW